MVSLPQIWEWLGEIPDPEIPVLSLVDLGVPASAPDKVRIRYGLQPATVRELVASGQQDMTSQWLPPEVMRALAEDGIDGRPIAHAIRIGAKARIVDHLGLADHFKNPPGHRRRRT